MINLLVEVMCKSRVRRTANYSWIPLAGCPQSLQNKAFPYHFRHSKNTVNILCMVSCFVKHLLYCDMFVYHSWEKICSPRPSNKQLLGQLSDWKPFLSDASVVVIRGLKWSIKGFKWNSDHWKPFTDEKQGLLRNEPWELDIGLVDS